ncbi:MAG: hypothetical protein QMD92_07855 [bacterium]|nr:hypothetical protein [bacterium]
MRFLKLSILCIMILFLSGWEACDEEPYIIPYEEGVADKREIQILITTLTFNIKSDEPLSIYRIERSFSPFYRASDDPATQQMVEKGLIPKDYIDISPTFIKFFQGYKDYASIFIISLEGITFQNYSLV